MIHAKLVTLVFNFVGKGKKNVTLGLLGHTCFLKAVKIHILFFWMKLGLCKHFFVYACASPRDPNASRMSFINVLECYDWLYVRVTCCSTCLTCYCESFLGIWFQAGASCMLPNTPVLFL